jgi:hypothetical protein
MKKIILPLLISVLCISTNAQQLPNSDFESWVTLQDQLDPSGFWTSDSINFIDNGGLENVSQSTDAHGGMYSAKIMSYMGVPGIVQANMRLNSSSIVGVPFNGRPVKVRGWSKSELNGEPATLTINFMNGPADNQMQIGGISHNFDGNYDWTLFEDTIIYVDDTTPVNWVYLEHSMPTNEIESTLYLDDLELVYGLTLVDEVNISQYTKLYPNPTSGVSTLVSQLPNDYKISITDITGKFLYQVVMQNEKIQLPKLNAGIYGVSIMNPNGKVVYRDKLITQ